MTTIVSENDFLNALDDEVQENSSWIKISQNETKRLQFILTKKPEYKEDNFQGQPTGVWKTFYAVIDVNSPNKEGKDIQGKHCIDKAHKQSA